MKTKLILGSVFACSVPIGVLSDELPFLSQRPLSAVALRATSPSGTAPLITVQIPRTDVALPVNVQPNPGIYTAAPYTMLVCVPPPIDPKIVMQPGENSAPARIIKPELRLIPREK
jgi:hypothetical protein